MLNNYNYGLIPNPRNRETGTKLTLSQVNQRNLVLEVQRCCAITPSGHYINFPESEPFASQQPYNTLQLSLSLHELKEKASCFYVFVVVNPSRCTAAVDFNTSQYCLPISCPSEALSLSLHSEQEVTKNASEFFQLPIARIRIEEKAAILDEYYIPPCVSIASNIDLLELHAELERFFTNLELHALQILGNILKRMQTNEMATIVQKLCENIAIFTAMHLAEIRSVALHKAPIYLINDVASLARLFKNTLDFNSRSSKEEFINYCAEWCEMRPGELEGCIADLLSHEYNHDDINSSNIILISFVKIMSGLFTNLARLEYIGKRKSAGIFVTEQPIESGRPKKRRGFFSEDEERSPEPNVQQPTYSSNKPINELEPVYLGASALESVAPGAEFTARFVAYIKSLEQAVQIQLRDMSPRATTHLGVQQCRWEKGTNVKVKLYGNYFSAEPSEQEFSWNGEYNIMNFDVKVSSEAPTTITILKFDVYVGDFLIARLRFDLAISATVKKNTWKTIRGEPIATAFASYASQDRQRVLDRVSEIRRVGIDIYIDCLSMHPGDEWKSTLKEEIKNRESFLLFWSSYAKQSQMVSWEWRTALAYKGINGIEPHPLCPVSEAQPPEELKELHFGDVYMLAREASNNKSKSSEYDRK